MSVTSVQRKQREYENKISRRYGLNEQQASREQKIKRRISGAHKTNYKMKELIHGIA